MAYSELVKNFNRIRDYMREFYVYGFKSRDEYTKKSARSYDDERRRLESWLGEYMQFRQTSDGKKVFISIDSRASRHNPLYKASWSQRRSGGRFITEKRYQWGCRMQMFWTSFRKWRHVVWWVLFFWIELIPMMDIIDVIRDSVDIIDVMKPVYNFKASKNDVPWKKLHCNS